ncbi:DUF2760 domain-containing protein [uncultured Desulfobacter sp.]|uniref:DUF2760 domain-containing protein n=1 Tax=uncultured Desulfobacter sp. TaxID=240139 RepID=UPI002AAC396B|nr:DUF2760 domain-containing protein [uncultured Desulfobacter sp.]
MSAAKAYARKSFLVIVLFMLVISGVVNAGIYFGIKKTATLFASGSDVIMTVPVVNETITIHNLGDLAHFLDRVNIQYLAGIVAAVDLVFLVLSLILWAVLKSSASSLVTDAGSMSAGKKDRESGDGAKKKDHADKRLEQERQQRLFLHFISVLQREGRLLDFFAEDLSLYEDDQIGAAVRSIQEDCKKSVDKYLALAPVIDKQEGDVVEVDLGFDPDAIRLTGNVSGEPPFKGVLRHRGWKAAKKEVPKLSDVQDTSIIAPADVEVE